METREENNGSRRRERLNGNRKLHVYGSQRGDGGDTERIRNVRLFFFFREKKVNQFGAFIVVILDHSRCFTEVTVDLVVDK